MHATGKVLPYSENIAVALCGCNFESLRVNGRTSGWKVKLKSACEGLHSKMRSRNGSDNKMLEKIAQIITVGLC